MVKKGAKFEHFFGISEKTPFLGKAITYGQFVDFAIRNVN